MGFSRQEHWSGLPFPPPGNLPDSGIEPVSPALAGRFFTTSPSWKSLGSLLMDAFVIAVSRAILLQTALCWITTCHHTRAVQLATNLSPHARVSEALLAGASASMLPSATAQCLRASSYSTLVLYSTQALSSLSHLIARSPNEVLLLTESPGLANKKKQLSGSSLIVQ